MNGLFFSIEEFSVFDGPGIRTTVFFKGCPLRCNWCHNPESWSFAPEPARNINACEGCGLCAGGLSEASIPLCPANALRICGEYRTPEELASRLLKNAAILNANNGGVTFSGGEPLSQPAFLLECLALLDGRLHRAVQTSGYAPENVFRGILSNADYILYDLKLMDEAEHKKYTGVSNRTIRSNFGLLCGSAVPFTVRVPLIPGVTDTERNIRSIAEILDSGGCRQIELLPYNSFAGGKYRMTGREYAPAFDEAADINFRPDIFEQYEISVKIL